MLGGTNTTIGLVATDAKLDKAQAQKVAQMAHDGLARTINPAHTMFDGDTIFTVATGKTTSTKPVNVTLIGALAVAVAVGLLMWPDRDPDSAPGDLAPGEVLVDTDVAGESEDSLADDVGCQKDTGDETAVCAMDGRCRVANYPLLSPRVPSNEGDRFGNPEAGETGSTGE